MRAASEDRVVHQIWFVDVNADDAGVEINGHNADSVFQQRRYMKVRTKIAVRNIHGFMVTQRIRIKLTINIQQPACEQPVARVRAENISVFLGEISSNKHGAYHL